MKLKLFIITIILISSVHSSNAQNSFAILQDWADYIGYQDTVYKIPSTYDTLENFITASFTVDSITGADILVAVYDTNGSLKWSETWSGSGNNRDQAVDVTTDDSCNIYVAGFTFSAATNFDIVVLKYDSAGNLKFTYTLNGTANNYDIPAAIKIYNNFLYLTGEISDTVSFLNYVTLQLDKRTGALNWKRQYDYDNYFDVAFAMDINLGTSTAFGSVTVAGASQDTLTTWRYCTVTYDSTGTPLDTTRITGTSNSFDRPMAVKCDLLGNFYITGAATDSSASFNVRTAKIDTSGGLAWVVDFGQNGRDDGGNDLIVDDSGYVYVSGKSNSYSANNTDYTLVKYDNSGTELWYALFDADSAYDEAIKMCFDNYGNIIMTGKATNDNEDILTIAYDTSGSLLWQIYFNGEFDGNDAGTDIFCDANGNIYVTGQVQVNDSTWQQVTIKYKTDYFIIPQNTVPAPSNLLFYPNAGQIIDTEDSLRSDIYYYTINQFPKLYFQQDTINFVFASIDNDTATTDTLERIAMNFDDGAMTDPYRDGVHDTDQVLNYFLGHCPDGITGVTGYEQLMFSDVYENTDVVFSNNSAGMKFQIIIKAGAEPGVPQLHFTGHQSLQLVDNADLRVNGVLGSFTYERPLVYQLDSAGNRISLGWLASYNIIDSANVGFTLGGSYDSNKPLVFDCAREVSSSGVSIANLDWSTYFGGTGTEEGFFDVTTDKNNDVYAVGSTNGGVFPVLHSLQTFAGLSDMTITKFNKEAALVWNTLYGGYHYDWGTSITVATQNDTDIVCVTGLTRSFDFPRFPLVDPANGEYFDTTISGSTDAFLVKLLATPDNSTWDFEPWAQLIGGCGQEEAMSIVHDDSGNVYMCGWSESSVSACTSNKFPIRMPNQTAYVQNYHPPQSISVKSGFVMEFTFDNVLQWSTFYGSGYDGTILYDLSYDKATGSVYVGGTSWAGLQTVQYAPVVATNDSLLNLCDAGGSAYFQQTPDYYQGILLRFNDLHELNWATLFGCPDGMAYGTSVATNSQGDVYFTGYTACDTPDYYCAPPVNYGFPICDPIQARNANEVGNVFGSDLFLAKFDSSATLEFSTFYGGRTDEEGDPAILTQKVTPVVFTDQKDNVFVTGYTKYTSSSPYNDFPDYSHANVYNQSQIAGTGPNSDSYLIWIDSTDALQWATLFGGSGDDAVYAGVQSDNYQVYLVGLTRSYDFPFACPTPGASPPWCDSTLNSGQDGWISRFDVRTLISVNEVRSTKGDFTVYPNPSSDYITVSLGLDKLNSLTFKLSNTLGETIIQSKIKASAHEIKIDINMLPPGIYFLEINSRDGIVGCKKFIRL